MATDTVKDTDARGVPSPTQQLLAHARDEHGLHEYTWHSANAVLKREGSVEAGMEYIDELAALMVYAEEACDHPITPASAAQRLRHHGSFDAAAEHMAAVRDLVAERASDRLGVILTRAERFVYSEEARKRHARLTLDTTAQGGGSLGHRTSTLLALSALVELPDHMRYRTRLYRAVSAELARAFPEHDRDAQEAKRQLMAKLDDLPEQIDALAGSGQLQRDVKPVLDDIHAALQAREVQHGWTPDPDRWAPGGPIAQRAKSLWRQYLAGRQSA